MVQRPIQQELRQQESYLGSDRVSKVENCTDFVYDSVVRQTLPHPLYCAPLNDPDLIVV